MAEPGEQTRAGSELPGLLVPGLVPPLLGVLAFALLRESYTWFYGRYGVVPEDVGISQIRMLTGVLRMFHLWSLPIPGRPAASFLLVLIGIWTYFAVGRWLLRRLRAGGRGEKSIVLRHPLLVGCSVLMLLVVLTSAWVVPKWGTCEVDSCRGVVWRVNESDAVIQVEVNPPDAHAPRISDPHPS